MRSLFHTAFTICLLASAGKLGYCQFDLPATTVRLENDTYTAANQYLHNGDRENAMNLINRDPLAARFALIRLLRDPGTAELAHIFADLFPSNSRSEIEVPFVQFYDRLAASDRAEFLSWIETASRAEYIVSSNAYLAPDKFWARAAEQAGQILDGASQYFKRVVFPTGQAFCVRMMALNSVNLWTIPSVERAQGLYSDARSVYETAHNTRGEALSLAGVASIYRREGDRDHAKEFLTEALKKTRSSGDKTAELYLLIDFPAMSSTIDEKKTAWKVLEPMPGLASLKYSFLFMLAGKEHDPESRHFFEMIVDMLARETDMVVAARANREFANYLAGDSYDYDKVTAIPYINRAIEITRGLPYNADATVAGMLMMRGDVEGQRLEYSKAEFTFLSALESLMRATDTSNLSGFLRQKSFLLLELAWSYEAAGDYSRAIERAQESLAIAEDIDFGNYAVQDIGVLARVHAQLGALQLAEQELTKASKMNTLVANEAFSDLARLHLDFGFYANALNDLEQLAKQFKDVRPGAGAASTWDTDRLRLLALTWLRIGNLAKAMEFAKATEARPLLYTRDIEEGLVGMVLMEMNKYTEAEKYFLDRFNITPSEPRKPAAQADAHKNLGRIYRIEHRRTEAIDHLKKALDIYRTLFRRQDELELLIELGQLALDGGRTNEARPYLHEALKLAQAGQWPQGIWSVRAALADVAKADNDIPGAIEQLKIAVSEVETVSARLNSELTRSTFVEDKIGLYDELVRLMGTAQPDESFEYAERRRAQSFIVSTRRQGIATASPGDSELVRQKREIEVRLVGKQKMLWDQLSKPPAAQRQKLIAAASGELDTLRSEHTELLRRIQESDPEDASRRGVVTAVSTTEVQRDILKPGDALVEYLVTNREIFAFVITPEQSRLVHLPAVRNVTEKRIQRLMAPFAQLHAGQVDLLHLAYDVPLAHQLYRDLIAPIEPYFRRARRLIVVPDDVLNYLPFESLARTPSLGAVQADVRYAEYQGVDWLVNHYTIVYAISATSLHPRFHRTKPEPESLLAFGNPKLTKSQLKTAAATLRGAGAETYVPALGPLPQSAREATSVARLLRSKVRTTVLTAEQARKAEFLRQGPSAGYIHFAVHSVVNEQQPYYSALVLSPDSQSDGLLQTYEILDMHLNARLVTLSSCESGLGKLYKGEGLLGLRRAFLMAGAESVVVSFWSIDDSTADFMEMFYSNIGSGQPIESALRNSKLRYLKKTMTLGPQQVSLSHPFFWAPFAFSATKIR